MKDNLLKAADNGWYKQRLTRTMFCVMIVFTALILRLFYLQVIQGKEFNRLSENNCIRLQDTNPMRGLIYDRNGELLVDNRPAFDLTITLKDAAPVKETIKKLSYYTEIPEEEFFSAIESNTSVPSYKPIVLKKDIDRDLLVAVEVHQFDLPGIAVHIRSIRNYVFKDSAVHLIGYMGEINDEELKAMRDLEYQAGDLIGKFGIEKSAEQYLKGKRGGRQVEVNSAGRVIKVLNAVDAEPGCNIYLSIDLGLQKKAEELMENLAGSVVAMEPSTGYILALSSSPSFDPNMFVGGISHENWKTLISNPFGSLINRSIQGEYPPASTYKIVTAVAGLEEGVIDENTKFYCPGYYPYGNRIFRCWRRGGHGAVNVVKALAGSCDVFFYQVGQRLGVDRLAKYAKTLGLASQTGIALEHEANGLIPTAAWKKKRTGVEWMSGENLPIAIGQGYNLVTPIQMAVLTSAVANGGFRYKPLIVKKIETSDGKIVGKNEQNGFELFPTEPEQIGNKLSVNEHNLELVRKGLWEVVNGRGTARRARIEDIEVSGKTGTGQVVGRKANSSNIREADLADHLKPHAWFVSYAPSDDPQIAVVVMVENGEHGSGTAAPVARELIKMFLKRAEQDTENQETEMYFQQEAEIEETGFGNSESWLEE